MRARHRGSFGTRSSRAERAENPKLAHPAAAINPPLCARAYSVRSDVTRKRGFSRCYLGEGAAASSGRSTEEGVYGVSDLTDQPFRPYGHPKTGRPHPRERLTANC